MGQLCLYISIVLIMKPLCFHLRRNTIHCYTRNSDAMKSVQSILWFIVEGSAVGYAAGTWVIIQWLGGGKPFIHYIHAVL